MPKKKPLKPIPKFETEAQEQEFWSAHDSTDYVDWSQGSTYHVRAAQAFYADDFYPFTGSAAGRFETAGKQARCAIPIPPQNFPGGACNAGATFALVSAGQSHAEP